jgi:Right handed beta helix region
MQRAADAAEPGDTVVVRPGHYRGGPRLVSLSKGGLPGSWITFQSEISWQAVLEGGDGQSLVAWYFGPGVGYIRIQGFVLQDLSEHGFDFYGGGVHDIVIADNHVHHIGRTCTDTQNGRTGASLGNGATRVTFDANVWHDIGRLAPGENGCVPKTTYYQNHDHGIYVADAEDITITNNVFYDFRRGWAIHRYFSRGTPSHGLLIANNTFSGANPYRPGQVILATPTRGVRIVNNIFAGPLRAALFFEDLDFSDGVVEYNLVDRGRIKVGQPRGVSWSHNWEGHDPRFVSGLDLRLKAGSPAIDVGLRMPEVTHDARGRRRPRGAGTDLGAYEY